MKNSSKRQRYYVEKKSEYIKYLNESQTKWKYMYREHRVYTYSFEDVLTFLEKELITYFCENNFKDMRVSERRDKLYQFYNNFKIYDLSKQVYISKSYDVITRIAEWNGVPNNLSYSYPVLKVDKEYPHHKKQHRPSFHTRDKWWYGISKTEKIAGTDPEYIQYLTMRQRHRDNCLNFTGYRKNRNNVPGDWKHYHKCRKQWAKNIINPSYEKLSKAVWKHELNDEKYALDEEYHHRKQLT